MIRRPPRSTRTDTLFPYTTPFLSYPLVVVQYDTRGFLRGGTGDEYPIQALAASGFAVLSVSRPIDYATSIARAGRPKRRSRIMAMRIDRASVHDSLLLGIRAAEKKIGIDRDQKNGREKVRNQ